MGAVFAGTWISSKDTPDSSKTLNNALSPKQGLFTICEGLSSNVLSTHGCKAVPLLQREDCRC